MFACYEGWVGFHSSIQVWELVDLPYDYKPIDKKWVLKIKQNAERSINKYNTCFVVKGYTYKEGIDHEEMFYL